MGSKDNLSLVGESSGYRFNVSNPGYIVNEGNLALKSGSNLTLLGGTVVNTGELSSGGGSITIAAVEGGSLLRISKPGHLLSLEVVFIGLNTIINETPGTATISGNIDVAITSASLSDKGALGSEVKLIC
ncbi:MAG: hypothetical protein MGG11_06735 [Trichodesmium sp. MAG_R03]|nr:hypothetical protein [Trichodesmium sp. MAG_R03]